MIWLLRRNNEQEIRHHRDKQPTVFNNSAFVNVQFLNRFLKWRTIWKKPSKIETKASNHQRGCCRSTFENSFWWSTTDGFFVEISKSQFRGLVRWRTVTTSKFSHPIYPMKSLSWATLERLLCRRMVTSRTCSRPRRWISMVRAWTPQLTAKSITFWLSSITKSLPGKPFC